MAPFLNDNSGLCFVCLLHISSEEEFDWEDEGDRKPRRNLFDDDAVSFDLIDANATWVSQKEVADFMRQSRGLSLSDNDDDEVVGEAWGGTQYSIASGTAVELIQYHGDFQRWY